MTRRQLFNYLQWISLVKATYNPTPLFFLFKEYLERMRAKFGDNAFKN